MSKERAPKILSPFITGLGGLAVGYAIRTVGTRRRLARSEMARQVAEQQASRLKKLSVRDPLTGLYNRRVLADAYGGLRKTRNYDRRDHDGSESDNKDHRHSLISLDIDHFKSMNDRFGHKKGDEILCKVANILMDRGGLARQRDVPVRMGGEEMSLLVPRATEEDALVIAEELRTLVAEEGQRDGCLVTASFGVAELDLSQSLEYNVDLADQALYAAKHGGRNQTIAYSSLPPTAPHNLVA